MSVQYRPEIDGLRAVAVGAVVLYHAGLPSEDHNLFAGGFLGVDVFFVLSGFLITSIILEEIDRTGRLSLANFYERRARRILPALLLVILAATAAGWRILLPTQAQDFAWSALASVFFVSNHYWLARATEYGAESGLLKPLLHTWSLSVEEQFYILFPLALIAALRWAPRRLTALGLGLVALGLAGAQTASAFDRDLSFFWLPSRVWELATGALLAHLARRSPGLLRGGRAARLAPALGLGLILAGMAFVRLSPSHPGVATVPAVLGTALVLWFADPREPVTRLLSSRPFVWLGLISYALYLWHYPVFAYGRLTTPEAGLGDKAVWIALAAALAAATRLLVEQPCRRRDRVPLRALMAGLAAAVLAVGAPAVALIAGDGLRGRLPHLIALYGDNEFDNEILFRDTWTPLRRLSEAAGMQPSQASEPSDFEAERLWFDVAAKGPKVLVVGDSHGRDMYNALILNAESFPSVQFARFALHARPQPKRIKDLFRAPNFAAATHVLISMRYQVEGIDRVTRLVQRTLERGKRVTVMLRTVEYRLPGGLPLFDWRLRQDGVLD